MRPRASFSRVLDIATVSERASGRRDEQASGDSLMSKRPILHVSSSSTTRRSSAVGVLVFVVEPDQVCTDNSGRAVT